MADRLDTIETLLELIESHCDDFLISNSTAAEPTIPPWYAFGYFHAPADPAEGHWEIDVRGNTLREVLTAFIADPRFGQ